MRRTIALAAAALALGSGPRALAAAPVGPAAPSGVDFPALERLERARVCWRVPDLACAADELAAARARADALDLAGQVALERLTAELALARGDVAAAAAALDALLSLSPGWTPAPGEASAALVTALEAARRRADTAPPTLVVAAPHAPVVAGRALVIAAQIDDPSGVGRAVLHVVAADGTVIDLALRPGDDGRHRGAVPAELVGVPEVRLWVEAWDALGNGPARWGEAAAPERVAVVPRDDAALTDRWWFWTAVGAGVVAGGVLLAVLLSDSGGDGVRPSEVGGLELLPVFP